MATKAFVRFSDLQAGQAAPTDLKVVGKVSAESVKKHTGKDWAAWIPLLQKAGAGNWTYPEIVAWLRDKQKLTPWWQQGVALGFEIATGRRKTGQDAKGKYMVTATKSLPAPVEDVWKALFSQKGLQIWLQPQAPFRPTPKTPFETEDGYFGEVRTVLKNRRARMQWNDPLWDKPTILEVLLVPRPGKKTILVFNHTGLPDPRTKVKLQPRWRGAADGLAELMARELGRPRTES